MGKTLVVGGLLAVGLGCFTGRVEAQAVSNPTTVQFVASADHGTTFDGNPILTRYDLRIYLSGATQPFQTFDIGKPTPDPNNQITVVNPAWFVGLAANSLYYARVVSIGPAGEAASDVSNPFGSVSIPRAPAVPPVVR